MVKTKVREGSAEIYIFPGEIKKSDKVFYNPQMRVNRDISSLAVQVFTEETGRDVMVLDVMASSGIRGIRYAIECSKVREVVFNDLNPDSIEILKENVDLNHLQKRVKIKIYNEDAGALMHIYRFEGDVVDLDPFGSPAYYLEALGRCVSNKGLAMVTFTDTAVLSGTYPRTALRRYGVWHDKKYTPKGEIALRVALKSIAESFAKFDKGIIPLVSISHKHYVRVIVKIDKHKSSAEDNIKKLKFLHFNEKQEKFYSYNRHEEKYRSVGLIWAENLGESKFIEKMIEKAKQHSRIYSQETIKILERLKEEYSIKDGFYYDLPSIGKAYKIPLPSIKRIKEKIESKGYAIAKSHIKGNAIVTNIPHSELVEVLKSIL